MSGIFDSQAFCPLAWNGVYIQPDGAVDNCCISKNDLGNINEQSIDEIVHNSRSRSVRERMLADVIVDGCVNCYSEKKTTITQRESLGNFYRGRNQDSYQSATDFKLRYVDIRLRNTCNYGCIYCGPGCSSFIAQERKTFPILDDSSVIAAIDFFKKNARDLDRIYLAGGEPLMIRENEILLEEIKQVNPQCHVLVNTNLSLMQNNKIFNILVDLPNVSWLISAEDMEGKYEYIRHKGSWLNFSKNLLALKSMVSREKISFNMVYLALNSHSILSFIHWLDSNDFDTENVSITWVHGNSEIDPRNLSDHYRAAVLESIERFPAGKKLRQCFDNIKSGFLAPFPQRNPKNMISFLAKNDKARNLDSKKLFTDIYQDVYQ